MAVPDGFQVLWCGLGLIPNVTLRSVPGWGVQNLRRPILWPSSHLAARNWTWNGFDGILVHEGEGRDLWQVC